MRISRGVKKFFLICFALLATLVVAMAVVVILVVKYPAGTWSFIERHFLPDDLKVQWETMDWNAQHSSWRHWDIVWFMIS